MSEVIQDDLLEAHVHALEDMTQETEPWGTDDATEAAHLSRDIFYATFAISRTMQNRIATAFTHTTVRIPEDHPLKAQMSARSDLFRESTNGGHIAVVDDAMVPVEAINEEAMV